MSAIVYQESDFYIQNITTFSQYVLNLTGNLDDAKLITIMGEYHDAKFDCKSDKKSIMVDEYVIEQSKDCKTKLILEEIVIGKLVIGKCAIENLKLIVHTNATAVAEGINPFTSGISNYTRIMKTMALRQALDKYGFDAAIGGSRRDEEKSRAKERIFSVRGEGHSWNPRAQRPELWRSFNTSLGAGESMRVFPLSDWTEADIWLYILKEGIQINELYFAQEREMIERNGQWIMVNDNRFPLLNGEEPQKRKVRFRTLGCYPLTASVDSTATTVEEIVEEVLKVKLSERATRLIDGLDEDSMEKKKSEGYF